MLNKGKDGEGAGLAMLHTSMTHGMEQLRKALEEGTAALGRTGDAALQRTESSVTAELGRMRSELRDTKRQLVTRDDLKGVGDRVDALRTETASLREEVRGVRDLLMSLSSASDATGSGEPGEVAEPDPGPGSDFPGADAGEDPSLQETVEEPSLQETVEEPSLQEEAAEKEADSAEPEPELSEVLAQQLSAGLLPLTETLDLLRAEVADVRERQAAAEAWVPTPTEKLGHHKAQRGDEGTGPELTEEHGELLVTASRTSSVLLHCHRDLWEHLAALAGPHPHWRPTQEAEEKSEGRVRVALSGRSLLALLSVLHDVRAASTPHDVDWALTCSVYGAISDALYQAAPSGTGERIVIMLDDRAGPDAGARVPAARSGSDASAPDAEPTPGV